jgi:hypothetical protein
MTLGEIAGWAGLVLAILLGIMLFMQSRRLGRAEKRLRALLSGAGSGADNLSLAELVTRQGERLETTRAQVERLNKAVTRLDLSVLKSLQCVGLVRFNPFEDTGGDQSFALALLDKQGNGVVISSLHGRTATRFYAKAIKANASPLSLSDEEARALKQAMGTHA